MPVEYDDDEVDEPQELARQVAAQAQGLQGPSLKKHLNRLRFPPALEKAFDDALLPARRRHATLCVAVGMMLVMMGARTDARMFPGIEDTLWALRLIMGGVLCAIALWTALGIGVSHRALENTMAAGTLMVVSFIFWTALNGGSLTAYTHSVCLFLVPIYIGVVLFQRFERSLLLILACMLGYPVLVKGRTPEEVLIVGENLKLIWISGILSLLGNYVFERHERHMFWLRQQALHHRLQLETLKRRLKRQSTLDALTGLHNRRHFDEALHTWSQAAHRPLSLLMIDVDHFKAYNDHHGHVDGDQCLRMIAGLLEDHAKRLQGLAARVGGEEFAILLPHCPVEDAVFMGQALCAAVRGEGMPHKASPVAPVVTICVGVSALSRDSVGGAAALYAQADAALYQAKGRGRNQCVQASDHLLKLTAGTRPQALLSDPTHPQSRPARPDEAELALIDQALTRPGMRLRLPGSLERTYRLAHQSSRQKHLILMGALGLMAYALMTHKASALLPDISASFVALREASLLAMVLAIASLLLPMSPRLREWLFAVYASALSVSTLYMFSTSHVNTVYSYVVAVALIPAFSAIGARQAPGVAWLPALSTVVALLAWMKGITPLQQVLVFDSTLMVVQAAILTLVGSFTLEHRHRQSFLLHRKDDLESQTLQRMSDELQRMALTDSLTGINNRRQFVLDMDAAWAQAVETQTPLALLIIDIDCFKAYNDSQGHAQGDLCLRQVAQAIARQARQNHGLPARLGGEEFAVILSGEAALQALSHAQDLCTAVQSLQIPHPESSVRPVVTVSIGVAQILPHQSDRQDTELMAWADEALYEAKTQGRNRAVQFRPAR